MWTSLTAPTRNIRTYLLTYLLGCNLPSNVKCEVICWLRLSISIVTSEVHKVDRCSNRVTLEADYVPTLPWRLSPIKTCASHPVPIITNKYHKTKHFHWRIVFDDMCKMDGWSFWSWFDVNRSTVDKDMRKRNIFTCSFPVTLTCDLYTSNLFP